MNKIQELSKQVESRTPPKIHIFVSFLLSHTDYMQVRVCLKEGMPLVKIQNLGEARTQFS